MRGLVNYFIKYGVSGNIIMVVLLVFGLLGLKNLQSTFFPEVPTRNISVRLIYPGASPEEIEESVVLKIEDNLKGLTGIERVTSNSTENAGSLNIEITRNADVDLVLQDVKNAVDRITSFPVGLESINVYKMEMMGRAISFDITGTDDLYALKKAARKVERDLLNMDGISQVALSGFPEEELIIAFDEQKLRSFGLTMAQVASRIQSTNLEATGGTIRGEYEETRIRIKNKGYNANEVRDIVVVSSPDGQIVRLHEIAEVKDGWAESPSRNYYNGQRSVSIDVSNTNDEDILQIAEAVNEYIEDFNEKNGQLKAYVTNDQSIIIQQRIDLLVENGWMGFVLVFVLLALFLHYRLAIWVALSIPIAFAGMFILANFFGITINVISLFGMITVIGILVDDGVVISENIYRHFEMGKSRIQAAIDGTLEVVPAVFSAILTTVVVFSAFFFIDGRLGDFFSEMAFIVIATLIFSLVEGILILPAHVGHSKALDRNAKVNKLQAKTEQFMNWMKLKLYAPVLDFSLRNKLMALLIPVALFALTIGAIKGELVKLTFFPHIEGDNVTVTLRMPPGTPDHATQSNLDHIEKVAWEVNKDLMDSTGLDEVILVVNKRLGPSAHEGTLQIKLLDKESRGELKQTEVTTAMREKIGQIPGVEELSFKGRSPFGMPVEVALQGGSTEELRMLADRLKAHLNGLADLKDVTDNDVAGLREWHLTLTDKAYLLGFTPQSILAQVRSGFFGNEVQRLQRGLDEVKVWLRYNEDERATVSSLEQMYVRSAQGGAYPLKELVDFELKRGVSVINHIDGKRTIKVTADIAHPDVTPPTILANLTDSVLPAMLVGHPDVSFSLEGQPREQGKSQKSMGMVMPIILILMLTVIALTFRSIPQMLAVLFIIPFALPAVAFGHWVEGLQISLFSWLGAFALIGIMVNDALVFVSAFNGNIKDGMPFQEALREASLSRFRPIILTSITTVAGLAPLMLNKSFQAQFLIPMAATIAYGLAYATTLILVLLPVLLKTLNDMRRWLHWYWHDEKPVAEHVEPAYKELEYENHQ